jgi:SAM-dependent methyltransferase
MPFVPRFLKSFRKQGPIGALRFVGHWVNEKFHERRLGIRSAGFISLRDLGFRDDCYSYEPITYGSVFTALEALKLRPGTEVFIDYGCGMGRALIAAATYPFKRVMGVELSEELSEIARANAARSAPRLRCSTIEVVTTDATAFVPPDDVTVVLLNNPFSEELVRQVLAHLLASLERAPRPLTVLFRFPEWATDSLEGHPAFRFRAEQRTFSEAGERLRIYEAVPRS